MQPPPVGEGIRMGADGSWTNAELQRYTGDLAKRLDKIMDALDAQRSDSLTRREWDAHLSNLKRRLDYLEAQTRSTGTRLAQYASPMVAMLALLYAATRP